MLPNWKMLLLPWKNGSLISSEMLVDYSERKKFYLYYLYVEVVCIALPSPNLCWCGERKVYLFS